MISQYTRRSVVLLLSTQQRQSDTNGRNDEAAERQIENWNCNSLTVSHDGDLCRSVRNQAPPTVNPIITLEALAQGTRFENTKAAPNGPIALQAQCVCHDTLPWLISFSLDEVNACPQYR
jgi:hypothetical protein